MIGRKLHLLRESKHSDKPKSTCHNSVQGVAISGMVGDISREPHSRNARKEFMEPQGGGCQLYEHLTRVSNVNSTSLRADLPTSG
jgi:hypothetical protein